MVAQVANGLGATCVNFAVLMWGALNQTEAMRATSEPVRDQIRAIRLSYVSEFVFTLSCDDVVGATCFLVASSFSDLVRTDCKNENRVVSLGTPCVFSERAWARKLECGARDGLMHNGLVAR